MSKETPVLEAKGLGIQFGGLKAVNDFSISIGKSELVGLIGPNGKKKRMILVNKYHIPYTSGKNVEEALLMLSKGKNDILEDLENDGTGEN